MTKMNVKILIVGIVVCIVAVGVGTYLLTRGPEEALVTTLPLNITSDTTYPGDVAVLSGSTTTVNNGAAITVQGNATIDGKLDAENGPLVLRVKGDLTINGTLEAIRASPPDPSPTTSLANQPIGIRIIVEGNLTFGSAAKVNTNGHIVITDNENQLQRTPEEIDNEVDSASGTLPTLVPLPPDHPAFEENSRYLYAAVLLSPGQASDPTIVVRGDWNFANFPGDRPIVGFRFDRPCDLNLEDVSITGPRGVNGQNDDQSGNAGQNAQGGNGRRGMRLSIWNNSGRLRLENVTLNLPAGGNGGNGTAVCGNARGGDGEDSGNFRIVASGGIEIDSLKINFGQGGNGGNATATCPGHAGSGHSVTATAGKGANNKKAIYVRGNVVGVNNVTLGPLTAGNGGNATATGGNGGDATALGQNGWDGGNATATSGKGGDALLDLRGQPATAGSVTGGNGGNATATGGNGGNGGDGMGEIDPGVGGSGGTAAATAGEGGSASGGAPSTPGTDGTATATPGLPGAPGTKPH